MTKQYNVIKQYKDSGFTLIEVLLAIMIIAIIGAAFSGTIYTGLKFRNINREQANAVKIGNSLLDEMKAEQTQWKDTTGLIQWMKSTQMNYSELSSGSGYLKLFKNETDSYNVNYEVVVTLEETPISGLFQVKVEVSSPNISKLHLTTRFRSSLSDGG